MALRKQTDIYDFGQGCDPQTLHQLPKLLLSWYDTTHRMLPWRENTDPYRVWVSEIMLQQTRVEAVIPYYRRFMQAFPTVQDLANASLERVLKLWEGLGYYSRARNLQKAAIQICTEYDGSFPTTAQELKKLSGIGEYTSGAIASISFGQRIPAVDGNVLRVLSRVLKIDADISQPSVKKQMTALSLEIMPTRRCGDYNQAMMELGATVCLPSGAPLCDCCPIYSLCQAGQQGDAVSYPYKAPKKPRVIEEKTVLVIVSPNGSVLLHQRQNSGLLAGLWEFLLAAKPLNQQQAEQMVCDLGLDVIAVDEIGAAKHIFTHLEWHMQGYLVQVSDQAFVSDELQWVSVNQLQTEYSMPTALKKYRTYLLDFVRPS